MWILACNVYMIYIWGKVWIIAKRQKGDQKRVERGTDEVGGGEKDNGTGERKRDWWRDQGHQGQQWGQGSGESMETYYIQKCNNI